MHGHRHCHTANKNGRMQWKENAIARVKICPSELHTEDPAPPKHLAKEVVSSGAVENSSAFSVGRRKCTYSFSCFRPPFWSSYLTMWLSIQLLNIPIKASLFCTVVVVGRPRSARAPGNARTSKKHGPSSDCNFSNAALISSGDDATALLR